MVESEVMTALNEIERSELAEHEAVIERGINTFVEVGQALLAIRDGKLYRDEHGTFEDYCRDRWGFGRNYANRMIRAADVVENLVPRGTIMPANEAEARPLARLEPEQQREAWQRAVETAPNGKMTAGHVRNVVKKMLEPGPEPEMTEEDDDEFVPDPATIINDWREAQDDQPQPPVAQNGSRHAVHFSSETPEHYTPREIIEAVIACMGAIDLDPCSNSVDDPNVPAVAHFTREDDGLKHPWDGRVYMNPPYGREIPAWVEKLVSEYRAENTTEAIALVPARTDTQWWQMLRDFPVCFIEGRLKFGDLDSAAPFPSAVFYLGSDVERFYDAFHHLGDIYVRYDR